MRTPWILVFLLVLASPMVDAEPVDEATPAPGAVVVLTLEDSIQPASLRYLERGLRDAAARDAALVVIELDTPGGLYTSMRTMISAILASPVPVAVYVTPFGARAASAGFFLLLASDVAAMAPGTNTGAAHPVSLGQEDEAGEVMGEKTTQDAMALARALATQRGRSVRWAERAIEDSRAYAASEALAHGLIEHVAVSRDALVRTVDGRTVKRADGTTRRLATAAAEVVVLERTFAERVLSVIADPQIAYLLLMLGALGLLLELMNPGLIVPGVTGALALLVGLYGLSMVPVSWVGALLIAAGLALVVAEVFVTSFGLLAVGGIVAFTIGSLMLVDTPVPDLRIGLGVVVPTALALLVVTLVVATRVLRARRLRPQTGLEAMTGEVGELVSDVDETHPGTAFVHGEYWTATAAQPLRAGTRVRIEGITGSRLRVAPVASGLRGGIS